MNLFIFRVETGTMLEFQLDIATESVGQLKLEITKILQVPPEDQVLLISGGICLENSAKVISYSSGTDTNPIFLFNKQSIESPFPPAASACPDAYIVQGGAQKRAESTSEEVLSDDRDDSTHVSGYSSYNEFRKRVLQSKNLAPSMETVTKRAKLAQEFYNEALRESKCCQSIYYDQQLQHQGWLAAIANLEDITNDFQKRVNSARQYFEEYLGQRESYVEFLSVYKEALDKLAKIPIIPSLLLTEFEPHRDETQEGPSNAAPNESCNSVQSKATKTLLEWIEARRDSESETTMDTLFETCTRGIEYYHAEVFANLYEEVKCAYETSSKVDMKEIHGLSDRLFGLDKLTSSCDPIVKEQAYSSTSIQNQQIRAGNLGDQSVLPDLCDSHRNQLVCMLNNHWKLCDIHKRCMRSKEELCNNLYQRLKWVIHAENLLRCSTDRIHAYCENVLRLRFNLSVLQQIHIAPEAYMSAVVEVLRRKKFSQAFLLWASELACYMLTIYNEEVTRRKDFKSKYEGHFLMGLFPGMNDLPPSFATQAPSIFDSSLPNVSMDDFEELRKAVPELTESLVIPDMTAITNFFLAKSQVKSEDKAEGTCEEKLEQVVNEVGLASNLDQNLLKPGDAETCLHQSIAQLKDLDRGCESETDTEEFEKVCQSPMDLQFDKDLPSPRPGYSDVTTITEVCDKSLTTQQQQLAPPRKPPRTFHATSRALSISAGSHTESFTNLKNTSLESIDELSSLRNVGDSCYISHHHLQGSASSAGGGGGAANSGSNNFVRSKSLSPHAPQSPRCDGGGEPLASPGSPSPMQGHQPSDFVNEEFYIDESLPSSLSIDAACGQAIEQQHAAAVGEIALQLSNANDVVALLQDNLQSSRSEQDKLKDLLINMASLYRTIVTDLRNEMGEIKTRVQCESSALELHCKSLSSSWDNLTYEFDMKEKAIHRLTESHQHELTACREQLKSHSDEIKCLREENSCLDSSLNKLADENKQLHRSLRLDSYLEENYKTRISELETKLQEKSDRELSTLEKERSLKETIDRMSREHKSEIDNLRKKFRFMTDRSPSECQDKADIGSPDTKRREPSLGEVERQRIFEEVRQTESGRVEKVLLERNKEFEFELNKIRNEARRTIDEKDKQIQELIRECNKQKQLLLQMTDNESSASELRLQIDILQTQKQELEQQLSSERVKQLTESQMEVSTITLRQNIESLQKENTELALQLTTERQKRMESSEMTASTSSCSGAKRYKYKEPLTVSQTSMVNTNRVNIESCTPGDRVLVMWKSAYKNFVVLQESATLHFVNSDCIRDYQPLSKDDMKDGIYFTAEVIDKEYCITKKSENRYNVPKSTKFYRVKILPTSNSDEIRAPIHMSQSQQVAKTTPPIAMDESVSDSTCHSLPITPTKDDK